jgi:TATA-box binding protein (TBP) (component of TFIID and TFIIIB)
MESSENFNENLLKTSLKVSVITVCADLGSSIDISKIYQNHSELSKNIEDYEYNNLELDYKEKKIKNADEKIKNSDSLKKNSFFFNCLKVTFKSESKISIKIFLNGRIQVTGSKSIETAHEVVDNIYKFIIYHNLVDNSIIKNIETFKIKSKKIAMINSRFYHNKEIDQYHLNAVINENNLFKYSTFNPNIYPGVNIKYKNSTVIAFRSGIVSVISKTSDELLDSYNAINSVLSNV